MWDAAGYLSASTHFVHWAAKPSLNRNSSAHPHTNTSIQSYLPLAVFMQMTSKRWHLLAVWRGITFPWRLWPTGRVACLNAADEQRQPVQTLLSLSLSSRSQHLSAQFLNASALFLRRSRAEFQAAARIFSYPLDIPVHTPHFSRHRPFTVVRLPTWLHDLIRNAIMKARKI